MSRAAPITSAIALAALAVLAGAFAAGAPADRPAVDAATTGKNSELRKTVPITSRRGQSPRIVLSMGPGGLNGLTAGDRLEFSSEVQVTVDCTKQEPRCAGRPYGFDPTVVVSLELAARRGLGAKSRVLARRKLSCGQQEPLRQHHCPVVFDTEIAVGEDFPCPLDRCFANLIVSAHSHKARGGERVIIGANKPSGKIVQDKSRLNSVRIGPDATLERLRSTKLRSRSLRLRPRRKVVLSQRVDELERGDVLAVSGDFLSDVRHLGYSALVGAELVAARGPHATSPSRLIRRSVSQRGQISPINGTNCTPMDSPCPTRKVGVLIVRRDLVGNSGGSAPLFVNLVMRTKQKRVEREHGARLRIQQASGLLVRRYSP